MTTIPHVAIGALLAQAHPALGLPLAVASHPILDAACRYHPAGLHWPWAWVPCPRCGGGGDVPVTRAFDAGEVPTEACPYCHGHGDVRGAVADVAGRWLYDSPPTLWQAMTRAAWPSKLLWLVNVACGVALIVGLVAGWLSAYALIVGGLISGWLGPDSFHLLPYRFNYPHRLADWLRARYWPRPADLPWGAVAEAVLAVIATVMVLT